MRIVVIGQASFGKSVVESLVNNGEEVVGLFCPPDRGEGSPVDPIKTLAIEKGIPVIQFKRMRDQGAIENFKDLNADLAVMAFVTDIVPMEMLRAPTKGTIQYHPSLLPKHRGPSSINWPIIQGETKTGLTIFWPDDGLDTGPVLLQKETEIGPDDTLGAVYFDRLFPMGVEAISEAVQMVRAGEAPRIAQDHSQATYEGWCRKDDVVIDWSNPITEVYNLIRGSDPSPGANTTLDGDRLSLYSTQRHDGDTGAIPGQVVEIAEHGVRVAANGGSIIVGRVQPSGEKKMPARQWADRVGLAQGAQLGD